jgi:hypothetical protein
MSDIDLVSPLDDPRQIDPQKRLVHLQRTLQNLVRRKLNGRELAARDHAAALMLRAELAAVDPAVSSEDVVRLANCARRAQQDFQRITAKKQTAAPSLQEVLSRGR